MKNVVVTEIEACRLCGNSNLESVLDLGDISITSYFPLIDEVDPPKAPLEMLLCSDCGLIQLRHSVNQDFLFGNIYGYRTGLNTEMAAHVEELARHLKEYCSLNDTSKVLDIGSNDGTFLNQLIGGLNFLVGVDPNAGDMKEYYSPGIQIIPEFYSSDILPHTKFDLISSIAMFYDVENPVKFARDIHSSLASEGIWFFEQSYAVTMFENNSFDTICHEHLMYYTLGSLNKVLTSADLKILDIKLSNANGGSIGIYASKSTSTREVKIDLEKLLHNETEKLPMLIKNFKTSVEQLKEEVSQFVTQQISLGRSFWCIGASTKGNTILSFFGLDSRSIQGIADKNPLKLGRVTPGTRIPIFPKNEIEKQMPDFAVVLPWHFKKSICENEKEFLSGGGTLLFPLPTLNLVNKFTENV
jgi:hypothetical protein